MASIQFPSCVTEPYYWNSVKKVVIRSFTIIPTDVAKESRSHTMQAFNVFIAATHRPAFSLPPLVSIAMLMTYEAFSSSLDFCTLLSLYPMCNTTFLHLTPMAFWRKYGLGLKKNRYFCWSSGSFQLLDIADILLESRLSAYTLVLSLSM